jgi:hypothetical protein
MESKLIVRSDKHLLNLMRHDLSHGVEFVKLFPAIEILQP